MKFDFSNFLKIPKSFNRDIDPPIVADGISGTIQNAKDLLADAKLLLDNKRYARCVTLSILAIEEKGKVEVLKNLLLYESASIAKGWKEIASHKKKNFMWLYPLLKHMQVFDVEKVEKLTNSEGQLSPFLDKLKQLSLYVDALENEKKKCYWSVPSEYVTPELAEFCYQMADAVVMDEGIVWNAETLKIFQSFAKLDGTRVLLTDQVKFYEKLFTEKLITEDKYFAIMANIFLSENPDIFQTENSDAE